MEPLDHRQFLDVVRRSPLVAIDLVVRDPDARVLLGYRTNAPARGSWFVPGGRVRKNERLSDAFRRIALEEIGVEHELRDARLLGVHEHFYEDNAGGEPDFGTHYVVLVHELSVSRRSEPPADAQHSAYRWFTPDELLEAPDVHDHTKAYFRESGSGARP